MKFYTNDKLNKIGLVNTINKLIKDVDKLDQYYDIDYIKSIRPRIDYVREFIDYYFNEIKADIDEYSKDYIVNRLYGVKGGPEVFNVMSQLLTVYSTKGRLNEFQIECRYEFPDLELLKFDTIRTTNINVFIKKLKLALFVLLFYRNINIIIKHLIQVIDGDLMDYTAIFVQPYVEVNLTTNDDLPWKH